MTFLAGMLAGAVTLYILQFISWYRRWKRKIALAQEENDHWCAKHAREA